MMASPTPPDQSSIPQQSSSHDHKDALTGVEKDNASINRRPATADNGVIPGAPEEKLERQHSATLDAETAARLSICDRNEEGQEDLTPGANYLHGWSLAIVMSALMAAVFMVALDSSIIATAIPRMTSDFNSLDDVAWYGSSYLLTQMSLQPSFGQVYTLFDIKWTYIVSFMIFEVGSVVCAASPTSTGFIIGRAVSGVGAAGMFCGGLLIIQHAVPLRKRPLYMSTVSTMYGIAAVAGPLLGGVFTDSKRLTWRFCFWLNLPLGALAMVALVFLLHLPGSSSVDMPVLQKLAKLDVLNACILTSSLVCLMLALQWGGLVYPWSDDKVWGCLLGFALITALFVYLQFRKKENAIIPIRIISQRAIAISCIFKALLQVAMMAQSYYLPMYFQAVKSMSAQDSGIRTLLFGVTISVATLVSGSLVSAIGYYVPLMWIGAAIFAVGSGLLSMLSVDSQAKEWLSFQVVSGIGYGVPSLVPFYAIQAVAPVADISTANALIMFFQCLGGALGLSIAQNIFAGTLVRELAHIPGVDSAAVIEAGASDIARVVDSAILPQVLEVYNYSLTRAFILGIAAAGAAVLCSLAMPWGKLKDDKKSKRDSTEA